MNIENSIRKAQELSKKNWLHALHVLLSAEAQHPEDTRLHLALAEFYMGRLEPQKALSYYVRALSVLPDDPGLIQSIASCYLAKRDYRLALIYFLRIKDPSDDILYNIGYTQALLGRNRDSIETMQKLLTRLPNHPYVYYIIIEQYYELGEIDQAIRYLDQARLYCGENLQFSLFGGLIYSVKGAHMIAYYHYKQASNLGRINNPDHMIRFAASAIQVGLPREAISILLDCEKNWPHLSEIYVNLMRTYLHLGEKQKAQQVLQRARSKVSRHSPSLKLMEARLKD